MASKAQENVLDFTGHYANANQNNHEISPHAH